MTEPDPPDLQPTRRTPRWRIAGGLLVAIVVVGGTWWAATRIATPEQLAAMAESPPPSVVVAEVVRRQLDETVQVSGHLLPGQSVEIRSGGGESTQVITDTPVAVGDEVTEGDVVLAINGRPTILIQGSIAAYRDLLPGMSGPDVEQLNQALRRLGFLGSVDNESVFGDATAKAVAAWYQDVGYEPRTTIDDLEQQRRLLVDQVTETEFALSEARQQRASDAAGPGKLERATAQAAVDDAERDLTAATAHRENLTASSEKKLREARELVAALEAGGEPDEPARQALAELEAATTAELASADEALASAMRNRELAQLGQEEVLAGVDLAAGDREIERTERQLVRARNAVADFDATQGVIVPMAELVTAPSTPLVVTAVNGRTGTIVDPAIDEPVLVLADMTVNYEALVVTSAADRITAGSPLVLSVGDGVELTATVSTIAETATFDVERAMYGHKLTAVLDAAPPIETIGQTADARVQVDTVANALVVPISAIYSRADGRTYVVLESADRSDTSDDDRSDRRFVEVPVSIELVSDGWVAVTSNGDGALSESDLVVVSR